MKKKVAFVSLLLPAIVCYVAVGPLIAIHQIKAGIQEQDAEKLERYIDFPTLRAHLKEQLNFVLMKQVATTLQDNPFAALGAALGSKLVDSMVDSFVTPSGLANLAAGTKHVRLGVEKPPSTVVARTTSLEPFKNVHYSYDSLSKFSVRVGDDTDDGPRFVLTRDGLSWRLTNVIIAPRPGQSSLAESNAADSNANEWQEAEWTDKMDNTPEVTLRKAGSNGAALVIRCDKGITEAYVDTDTIVDSGSVRIKFDQSTPVRQYWTKSADDKALFAPDAVTFARQLTKARTFLIEFAPFNEEPRTVSFDVTRLDARLKQVSQACNWDAVDRQRAAAEAAATRQRAAAEAAATRQRAAAKAAEAAAEAAEAALEERLIQHVHPCRAIPTMWCWSDPNGAATDGGFTATKGEALQDAMEMARSGYAFKNK